VKVLEENVQRKRIREMGIRIGKLPTGPYNAITEVPGGKVGHTTVIFDRPRVARTGVTVVVPRAGSIREDCAFAGSHSFNGNGEMTGLLWVEESGLLTSPIGLTNTNQVGVVRDALVEYTIVKHNGKGFYLPVVGETWDGVMNNINAFSITKHHVFDAMRKASSGPVQEGSVGGGTGMICHDFKAGIGTSSRVVETKSGAYTVGVLVQANYGDREQLRVNGVPVGLELPLKEIPTPRKRTWPEGSIIVIIATDAPLLSMQCKRLAQRATVGLARVGGVGHNGSGDIFLAFSVGNHVYQEAKKPVPVQMLPHHQMDPLFCAVADATEEAILNSLTAAETMHGFRGRTAHALPLDALQKIMARYGRRE
jgi:D-aminopeptidase